MKGVTLGVISYRSSSPRRRGSARARGSVAVSTAVAKRSDAEAESFLGLIFESGASAARRRMRKSARRYSPSLPKADKDSMEDNHSL